MPLSIIPDAEIYHILVVDDEPDVHKLTKLSLKGMTYQGKKIVLDFASTGKEAVEKIVANPAIAVMLLDVVMETNSAGLDACQKIRDVLGNHFVRILLRTGQPGSAPEKQTIDEYDIDGYLPKTELTSTRLYSAVRTALKSWNELVELERHRQLLTVIHEGVISVHSFEPLDVALQRILETSVTLCPTSLAVLQLETFEEQSNPRKFLLHLNSHEVDEQTVAMIADRMNQNHAGVAGAIEGGYLLQIQLHREMGSGWIYLDKAEPDDFATKSLPILASHAGNVLYSAVAQAMLTNQESLSVCDEMII